MTKTLLGAGCFAHVTDGPMCGAEGLVDFIDYVDRGTAMHMEATLEPDDIDGDVALGG